MRLRIIAVIVMMFGLGHLTGTSSALAGSAGAGSDVAAARQFSAELVSSNAAGDIVGRPGKIYVGERKVRIETPDFPDSFLLIDGAAPAAYLVRPQSHVFMDAKQSSRLTRLFVPLDSGDPCPQWESMADVAGIPDQRGQWHCEAGDHAVVAGRNTVKVNATSPRGRSVGWIDPELKFPVKIETEDGIVFMLRAIAEGPQPAELFVIPAGYKKFDPRRMLEQFKDSDVFVEPTH